jgi:hypothetical protein
MSKAITEGSCDIVGLARPLTAELHFCADILSGKTTKAKENLVDEPIQTACSCLQLAEVGFGHAPSDLSNPEVVKRVEEMIRNDSAGTFEFLKSTAYGKESGQHKL